MRDSKDKEIKLYDLLMYHDKEKALGLVTSLDGDNRMTIYWVDLKVSDEYSNYCCAKVWTVISSVTSNTSIDKV